MRSMSKFQVVITTFSPVMEGASFITMSAGGSFFFESLGLSGFFLLTFVCNVNRCEEYVKVSSRNNYLFLAFYISVRFRVIACFTLFLGFLSL